MNGARRILCQKREKNLKDKVYTIEVTDYINLFEWDFNVYTETDVMCDLSRIKDAGMTHYDHRILLF
jgi:hypothetical protein